MATVEVTVVLKFEEDDLVPETDLRDSLEYELGCDCIYYSEEWFD